MFKEIKVEIDKMSLKQKTIKNKHIFKILNRTSRNKSM